MTSVVDESPLVSIGLPVYNGEKLLPDLLDSVLAQSFSKFELIISDNGSTDRTVEICTAYAEKDERVKLSLNSEDRGPSYNFTKVLSLASCPFFIWLAHDDVWEHNHLESMVDRIKDFDDVILSVNGWYQIDDNGKSLSNSLPLERIQSSLKNERFKRYLFEPYFDVGKACFIYGLMRTSAIKNLPVDAILGEIHNIGANRPIGRDVLLILALMSQGNISYNPNLRTWGYRLKGVKRTRSQTKKLYDFLRFPLEAILGKRKSAIQRIRVFYRSLCLIVKDNYGDSKYLKFLSVIASIRLMALFK